MTYKLDKVTIIGSSTPGYETLKGILPEIDVPKNAAIICIPHVGAEVIRNGLKKRNKPVKYIDHLMMVEPGWAYIGIHSNPNRREEGDGIESNLNILPRGDGYLFFRGEDIPYEAYIDPAFINIAKRFRENTLGIIADGFGSDGAKGIEEVKNQGGTTLVEKYNEKVKLGMPHAAVMTGKVDKILTGDELKNAIIEFFG